MPVKDLKKATQKRKEKGDGYIRKTKSGTFEGSYYIHKVDETEIRKSFTRRDRTEIKDIIAHLKVLEPLDADVIDVEINKQTNEIKLIKKTDQLIKKSVQLDKEVLVDDYVEYWLWHHRRKGQKGIMIKNSTFTDYMKKGKIIKDRIGEIKLENGKIHKVKVNELTLDFIEAKLLELFRDTCYTTALNTRNHIKNMMVCAKKDGIIESNPLADEQINFPSTQIKKRKIVREEDIQNVIKLCLKYWYIDVFTQIITGARVSEIRGLRWENIDIDNCKIHYDENYLTTNQYDIDKEGHIVLNGTTSDYTTLKSSSSERTIEIEKDLMEVLKIHKELQKQFAERQNVTFKETDPVFTGRWYKQLGRNTTNERVKRVAKELGIKDFDEITSHCLRKSFCYAGLLNDVPLEYMSKLMRT